MDLLLPSSSRHPRTRTGSRPPSLVDTVWPARSPAHLLFVTLTPLFIVLVSVLHFFLSPSLRINSCHFSVKTVLVRALILIPSSFLIILTRVRAMDFTFNFMPRPRHVFATEDSIFVSPNSSILPPRPTVPTINLPNNPLPSEGSILHWSMDAYPYLPYCLQSPRYSGPLLQRLSYRAGNLPVECVDNMWRLCPKVAHQWRSLETCLISATQIILDSSDTLNLRWFRKPEEYLYRQQFDTRQRMVGCAMRSRDAFLPLMATCSYVISHTPNFTASPPPWSDMLRAKGLHPEWVNMLETSQLADFSEYNKRVGVFVLPTCKYLQDIDKMLRANVPIWFCWDNRVDFRHNDFVYQRYCPTTEEVRRAQCIALEERQEGVDTSSQALTDAVNNSSSITHVASTVTEVTRDDSAAANN